MAGSTFQHAIRNRKRNIGSRRWAEKQQRHAPNGWSKNDPICSPIVGGWMLLRNGYSRAFVFLVHETDSKTLNFAQVTSKSRLIARPTGRKTLAKSWRTHAAVDTIKCVRWRLPLVNFIQRRITEMEKNWMRGGADRWIKSGIKKSAFYLTNRCVAK